MLSGQGVVPDRSPSTGAVRHTPTAWRDHALVNGKVTPTFSTVISGSGERVASPSCRCAIVGGSRGTMDRIDRCIRQGKRVRGGNALMVHRE